MKFLKIMTVVLIATSVYAASGALNIYVSGTRPTSNSWLTSRGSPNTWGVGAEYGWRINDYFMLGPKMNLSWNLIKDRRTAYDIDENTNWVLSRERIVMMPVSAFFAVDPIPQFMIHPILHAQVGYNSVFISNSNYDKAHSGNVGAADGYYNGVFVKFGVDCMIDIGKQVSIFAGPQWQFTTVERRKKDTIPLERVFNGFGLRAGVSILL